MEVINWDYLKIYLKDQKSTENFQGYFKMLNGYTPAFTTYNGGIYEMEITRAAIHAFAIHCSKLQPEMLQAIGKRTKQN